MGKIIYFTTTKGHINEHGKPPTYQRLHNFGKKKKSNLCPLQRQLSTFVMALSILDETDLYTEVIEKIWDEEEKKTEGNQQAYFRLNNLLPPNHMLSC